MTLSPAALAAIQTAGLSTIGDKVLAGERLTFEDAQTLYASSDIVAIGALANHIREQKHGDVSWFNRNQHINATNVCEATCIFCSFSRLQTGQPGAYTMSYSEAVGRLKALKDTFISEVHIVNGLNPDLPFEYYPELLQALKAERPDLHIKGFTAVEIYYYAAKYNMTNREVLQHLRDAGLDSMPGGGAEIFADRARKKLCHDKVTSQGWLDIHETAHEMGFRTNATMLFGSIETLDERIDHMDRLRNLQDKTGGFQTFIPLKFHNENNRLRNVAETTDLDCWKTLAIGRLFLDNFPHVKAYWPMMGVQVAQLSQAFGVSDIDGTVREERIYHMAGAKTPQGLTRPELVSLIDRAGRRALERDTLYRVIAETPGLIQTDEPAPSMRIASVGYLNAWPLSGHVDREKHDVVEAVPSLIAERLHKGEADVALVPVAAILAEGDWRVVPGMAIGADGPVESVLLVSETPPEEWTEVLLDGDSRTSAILSQLLLRRGPLKMAKDATVRTVGRGEAVAMASGTTAALVIGDVAREVPERMIHRFDLAGLWKEWTGLPFVFAVWAGAPTLDPRIGVDLRAAAASGIAHVHEKMEGADRVYLTERLRYDLDDRAMMGLRRFASLGKEEGFFQHGDIELLGPVHTTLSKKTASLEDLLVQARAVQSKRNPGTVKWGLVGTAPEAYRVAVAPDVDSIRAANAGQRVCTLSALEGRTDVAELAAAGLTHVSLDDGGALLTDPVRLAAANAVVQAGLVLEGALIIGRGETEAARKTHLGELERLGAVRTVLRVPGWREGDSDGSGTAADWLRAACTVRLSTSLELVCPWQTEAFGVMAVALQSCVDGIESMDEEPKWELNATRLDRAIRDAGFEPERLGMPTPAASGKRVARRASHQAKRADLR